MDWLGTAARVGIAQVYRQKLIGRDNYDLITLPARGGDAAFHRNPDYYTSLLWRGLIGPRILSTTATVADQAPAAPAATLSSPASSKAAPSTLRLTAACTPSTARNGGKNSANSPPARVLLPNGAPANVVVVVYANWAATEVGNLSFDLTAAAASRGSGRGGSAPLQRYTGSATLYALESGAAKNREAFGPVHNLSNHSALQGNDVGVLESNRMLLNGVELGASSPLVGKAIPVLAAVVVPGYSLGFLVLNDAKC